MKTQNQQTIQEFMNEGDYAPMYPIISESNLNFLEKVLVSHICNDVRMNGMVTWKQETYATKIGSNRQTIFRAFKRFVKSGLLVPYIDNKAGSKSNKYDINLKHLVNKPETSSTQPETSSIYKPETSSTKPETSSTFKPETSSKKPETSSKKPETSSKKPETSSKKPVTPVIHIKKIKETNKENNKEILKKENPEETSFFVGKKEHKVIDIDTSSFYNSSEIRNSNMEHLEERSVNIQEADMEAFLSTLEF
jgi:hypothetical protein